MKENNNVILIGCDSLYYKDWGIALLTSMQVHIPWINLHCHIVNPDKHYQKIAGVTYTTEERTFVNEESKISYLQAARFLAVQKYCNANDFVMTIDCDSICVTPFEEKDFRQLFTTNEIPVLQHPKHKGWLAGLVTFNKSNFRNDFANMLLSIPIDEWKIGRDQVILAQLANNYNFSPVQRPWMNIGKLRLGTRFLTLKGAQKTSPKYLPGYEKSKENINLYIKNKNK